MRRQWTIGFLALVTLVSVDGGCGNNSKPREDGPRDIATAGEGQGGDRQKPSTGDARVDKTSSGITGEWDPADTSLAPYLAQLARLRAGESADLNLDGVDEVQQSKDASGVVTIEIDGDKDGNPEYRRTFDPAKGEVVVLFDDDSDGFAETRITRTKSQILTEKDTDADQVYDWRQTDVLDWTAKTVSTKVESDGGSGFKLLYQYQRPFRREKCGSRDPGSMTPPPTGPDPCNTKDPGKGSWCLKNAKDICISNNAGTTDGADGSCSQAHAQKLAKAVSCAINRNKGCMANTNSDMSRQLGEQLFTGSLSISCGTVDNPASSKGCNAQGSNANVGTTDRGGNQGDMSFNSDTVDKLGDDELCAAMLHEMLHWADASDDGDLHGDGVDKVYACGRYCGGSKGCQQTSNNTPGDCGISGPSWDCARCAGSADEQAKCGYYTKVGDGGEAPPGICHGGLFCIMGNCSVAKQEERYTCDGTMTSASFLCCATCSTGCTQSNDLPCTSPPAPTNKCGTPECN